MSESVDEEMGNTHPHSPRTHPLTNSSTHPPKTPIIQVKHLSKRYQIGMDRTYKTLCESITDTIKSPLKRLKSFSRQEEIFWALKDINFEVYPGEVVGIIGRNGAGKTTLLKILSRITHPTEGEVVLRGRVGSLLEVGTGFHPELTGRENIYFNGAILGMTKQEIEDKFDEIVGFSGVADFLDTPLKRYSSGMQVRLAFSVAAYLEPEILMVDEVLAVGDAEFQKMCLGKMKAVSEGGRTVLFVSHNMAAVTRLCERTILLDQGKVVHDGPTPEVTSLYLTSGLGLSSERRFEDIHTAPGDDAMRLRAVRVRDAEGNGVENVDIRQPIGIEVEYWILSAELHPSVNVHLFNEVGINLFVSHDFNNPTWRNQRHSTGLVKSTCWIPGNFLAEGHITVLVGIATFDPDIGHVDEHDVVSFQVIDRSEGDGVRGEYPKEWPGVVRPMLEWTVDFKAVEPPYMD